MSLDAKSHQEAVRNEAQELSLLGSNEAGTLTRRVLINSSGRVLVDTESDANTYNLDNTLAVAALDGYFAITRDANNRITQVDRWVPDANSESVKWRRTITRDANGYITSVTAWAVV